MTLLMSVRKQEKNTRLSVLWVKWKVTGLTLNCLSNHSRAQGHILLVDSMMQCKSLMNISSLHRQWCFLLSVCLCLMKLKSGTRIYSTFLNVSMNGLNAKVNGHISNRFLILQILLDNFLRKIRNSSQLIRIGKVLSMEQLKIQIH